MNLLGITWTEDHLSTLAMDLAERCPELDDLLERHNGGEEGDIGYLYYSPEQEMFFATYAYNFSPRRLTKLSFRVDTGGGYPLPTDIVLGEPMFISDAVMVGYGDRMGGYHIGDTAQQ